MVVVNDVAAGGSKNVKLPLASRVNPRRVLPSCHDPMISLSSLMSERTVAGGAGGPRKSIYGDVALRVSNETERVIKPVEVPAGEVPVIVYR